MRIDKSILDWPELKWLCLLIMEEVQIMKLSQKNAQVAEFLWSTWQKTEESCFLDTLEMKYATLPSHAKEFLKCMLSWYTQMRATSLCMQVSGSTSWVHILYNSSILITTLFAVQQLWRIRETGRSGECPRCIIHTTHCKAWFHRRWLIS